MTPARGDTAIHRGLRVSSPARMWCELSVDLALPELVAAGDYLVQWEFPIIGIDALSEAVERYPVRVGGARLRHAAGLLDAHSESPMESELRVIVVTGGLPPVTANLWIPTSSGHRYRGDLVFEGRRVIVEYQSVFHFGPEAFRKDMTRISRLEANVWAVIQVNLDDLGTPIELVARIRRVLDRRQLSR